MWADHKMLTVELVGPLNGLPRVKHLDAVLEYAVRSLHQVPTKSLDSPSTYSMSSHSMIYVL
jgi:hypothetical protein